MSAYVPVGEGAKRGIVRKPAPRKTLAGKWTSDVTTPIRSTRRPPNCLLQQESSTD